MQINYDSHKNWRQLFVSAKRVLVIVVVVLLKHV